MLARGSSETAMQSCINPAIGDRADVVGVGEAIETVMLNLRKSQDLIALGTKQ
jgi:hypothetical protein